MPEVTRRPNTAAWWALLLAVAAMSVNYVFFGNPPLQAALPWLGLVLAVAALIYLAISLRRSIAYSQIYRGKWLSITLALVALVVSAATILLFGISRALPSSAAAPQVGQQLPDFTLPDTSGQPVSLDGLLASTPAGASVPATKGVLLIFYRGYW